MISFTYNIKRSGPNIDPWGTPQYLLGPIYSCYEKHIVFYYLKGLAMIFTDQENPFIIFRSKEINIHFKTNTKIPINLLK